MKEEPRKMTLKILNLISFSRVVIIMHITRFNLVNSFLAREIDFRMSIIMSCS